MSLHHINYSLPAGVGLRQRRQQQNLDRHTVGLVAEAGSILVEDGPVGHSGNIHRSRLTVDLRTSEFVQVEIGVEESGSDTRYIELNPTFVLPPRVVAPSHRRSWMRKSTEQQCK
jgi:hypothetical protein